MSLCRIIINDEVYCTIVGLKPQHNTFLYDKFGILVPGAFHMPLVKLGRWDGKVRFFEKTGKTYVRLLDEIVPHIMELGYDFSLEDRRIPAQPLNVRISENHFSHIKGYGGRPLMFRPYQVNAINKMIESGSGFVLSGTGSGKTMICAGLCDMYGGQGFRTVTIVPSGDLVSQTLEAYQMCEMDAGEYSGAKKQLDNLHLVATWQSLQNNPYIMHDYHMVLIDESHGAKANVTQKLINDFGSHIPYRYGVTGTFPKELVDQYTLRASIGPILHEITSRWLIDNGYLAKINIEVIQTMESESLPDYQSEKAYLSKKESRLELIAELVQEKAKEHGNTLVLVNSIKLGRLLTKLIPGSIFMSGETDRDERKTNYDEYETQDNIIKIASSGIASTGISIDRIFCLFMIDSGKSFIKAIQSIGRGSRLAADKNSVHVVDLCSSMIFSKRHLNDRKKYYKEAEYPISKIKKIKYE